MTTKTHSRYFSSRTIERATGRGSHKTMAAGSTRSSVSERATTKVMSQIDLSPKGLTEGFSRAVARTRDSNTRKAG